MKCRTNSFPRKSSLARLIFLIGVLALPALAQTRSGADPYQKIALKTTKPCTVGPVGELTALVKNGAELSVNEDFDCDGVPDAYDNCVGMPNPSQTDSDGNGIGDVCEAAVTIKAGPAKEQIHHKAQKPQSYHAGKDQIKHKAKSRKSTPASG